MKVVFYLILISSLFFERETYATEPYILAENSQIVNTKAKNPSYYFPDDTVKRFIANLGKDSLISLLDKKIALAQQYLQEQSDKFKYDFTTLEYILVSKKYKLKVDFSKIDTTRFADKEYRLYDLDFGNTKRMEFVLDSAKAAGVNMLQSLKSQLSMDYVRYMIPFYCKNLVFDKEIYDSLLNYSNTNNINDKLQTYWKFAELNRKCSDVKHESSLYQEKLFNELYVKNNPKVYYLDTILKELLIDSVGKVFEKEEFYRKSEMEAFYTNFNPLRMLAYALYANDVNMSKYDDNLIYLLDAQQINGSWSHVKKFNSFHSDPSSTIYGVWALCEFRDKLKNWK